VGKHVYKEVKHDDRFHEALSGVWAKYGAYIWGAGLAMGVLLVVVIVWVAVSRLYAGRRDRPWVERFELRQSLRAAPLQGVSEQEAARYLAKMNDLAREYRGRSVAALTLLELAQEHFGIASGKRDTDPKAAKEHLEEAVGAAERLVADLPDHAFAPLAHFEAGKALFELRQYERAAQHFEQARACEIDYVSALAALHAGRCYERLGRLDDARRAYESVRNNKMAGWCGDQAEFQIAELDRRAARRTSQEKRSSAPSSATPAPSE